MAKAVPEETIARLLLVRFLAKGFSYPDADLLDLLAEDLTWEQLLAADEVLALDAEAPLAELRGWLAGYEDEERLLLDLGVEHTYLFITTRPHVPAPPYESAYHGRGLLMGEPVSQVLEAYRAAGLAMHRDYDALPDHVTAELEFAAYLLQQELEADQAGDDPSSTLGQGLAATEWREHQRRFWQEHLLHWLPEFLEKVTTGARQPFYRLLADLVKALVGVEERRFPVTAQNRVKFEEETHGESNVD